MNDIIIKAKNVTKLYGLHLEEAKKMLLEGATKEEVNKKTKVTVALDNVSLQIPRGEIFVIIGLSGSGKSTLVRCFNRLNKPTSGQILFEDQDLTKMNNKELRAIRRDKIAMVFQTFGLMSHKNVLGNVEFGLEVKGVNKVERKKRALDAISLVGLEGWEENSCDELSGGMCQRVGLARALANDPDLLLMDEPFSALDPLVRKDMQFELLSIQRKLGKTIIFITHDIDEAFKLGDTIAIMRDGRVIQVDKPEYMSANPADEYVRKFIDSADKAKVITVKNIMRSPVSLVRKSDGLEHSIREMRKNDLASICVVDSKMNFEGIISISDALKGHNSNQKIPDVIIKDVAKTSLDTLVEEIMPLVTQTPYPIAVVDDNNKLLGIVTKTAVLSSLL